MTGVVTLSHLSQPPLQENHGVDYILGLVWWLATEAPDGLVWFWIGSHAEYDQMIG